MQKRSYLEEIRYAEVGLDSRLPITGGMPFCQNDKPITFLHFHECLELGYCYSGSGIFVVGEKILPFQAGDVSFINRTEVHLARSAPGTTSEWTWIYLDPVRLVGATGANLHFLDPTPLAGPGFDNLLPARSHPAINRIVLDMVDELRSSRQGSAEALRALAWQMMVVAGRLAPATATGHRPPEYGRVVPALQYMADRYAEPVDIGRLARLCHTSSPHFRRIFLRTVGQSPREYWHALRLRMAASLLRGTQMSILEISQDVGFQTLSSFNRLFLKVFHASPRQWRQAQIHHTSSPPILK